MDNSVNNKNLIKLEKTKLDLFNKEDCINYFGNWVNNIETLKQQFIKAEPFENVVIDNFLDTNYAEKLYNLFPKNYDGWYKYINPIEVKYAYDDIDKLDSDLKNYFYYLSTNKLIEIFRKLTDIDNLTYDEYLHGAGLHCHPRNGMLNIHLDYEKHPYSGKERRINIIYFLSKDWKEEWNGQNELWNKNVTKCIKRTDVKFNRAIIFKTNNISWHGLPERILCPKDVYRKSLAYYYVSPLSNLNKMEEEYRKKAKYVNRPNDTISEGIQKLYEIRPYRRITQEDIDTHMPKWKFTDIT
jgi:Rps23 Pro-64 3,4-dihydroxylase Tpa1-like proline 4-hydroxylase